MPYKRDDNVVYHKKNGKWTIKQVANSSANARAALRLLRAVDHGWKPTRRK